MDPALYENKPFDLVRKKVKTDFFAKGVLELGVILDIYHIESPW